MTHRIAVHPNNGLGRVSTLIALSACETRLTCANVIRASRERTIRAAVAVVAAHWIAVGLQSNTSGLAIVPLNLTVARCTSRTCKGRRASTGALRNLLPIRTVQICRYNSLSSIVVNFVVENSHSCRVGCCGSNRLSIVPRQVFGGPLKLNNNIYR